MYKDRGVAGRSGPDGEYYASETNTDYLNKHAHEWEPPLGQGLHLHLIYARTVHWRVVDRASSVCKVPGRCYRVDINLMVLRQSLVDGIHDAINATKEGRVTPWEEVEKSLPGGPCHTEHCAVIGKKVIDGQC